MSIQASKRAVALDLMERMLRIRRFEERAEALQASGEIGDVHLYIGQEATAAGVCASLRADDYIASNHRGHGHIVAKGGDLGRCMAELFGRATGYCGGKGGSMHIADLSLGIIGANGIVGAGIALANGAGLAASMTGSDQVSVAFFGDGASCTGVLHESLNLAAIWSLPVLFVCENNGWTELSRMERLTARGAVAQHGEAYGIPGVTVDGNDALAVHAVALEAIERARAGQGPTLIEARTFRMRGHSQGVAAVVGQLHTEAELTEWGKRDPIPVLRAQLLDMNVSADELDELDASIVAAVEEAVEFARQSARPTRESAFSDVWAPSAVAEGVAS